MRYYIGIDLGGTAIKGGILDDQSGVVASCAIDTQTDSGIEHVIDRIAELARSLADEAKLDHGAVAAMGIGTPGPIDPQTGIVLEAPNLGWKNVPLGAEVTNRTGWSAQAFNDANAACFGEFTCGVARDETITDMILLTLGTGIGGGIVIGGRLFEGVHGAGAELGHLIVERNGRPCACTQRGCIEQYASATAVARQAKRRIDAGDKTSLTNAPTTKQVFDAAATGDQAATKVIDEACDYLGAAIVSYTHVLDPQMVVLGGGMAAAGEPLLRRVRDAFARHNWQAAPPHVAIELATLGNDAGFIGAASLARSRPA